MQIFSRQEVIKDERKAIDNGLAMDQVRTPFCYACGMFHFPFDGEAMHAELSGVRQRNPSHILDLSKRYKFTHHE